MPRHMSFAMTTAQVRARTKTVTRRFGWKFLKAGDRVWAVEKAMGLKKGEAVKKICLIEIISTRWEPLSAITVDDVAAEGFGHWTPFDFITFLCGHYGCDPDKPVNRIEFKYVDGDE